MTEARIIPATAARTITSCGPLGLRTPEEMVKIAQAKMDMMERHPKLEWIRREDEEARAELPRSRR